MILEPLLDRASVSRSGGTRTSFWCSSHWTAHVLEAEHAGIVPLESTFMLSEMRHSSSVSLNRPPSAIRETLRDPGTRTMRDVLGRFVAHVLEQQRLLR